jgi:ABC-type phosphate/phosphonate transport system substrate-binding protein
MILGVGLSVVAGCGQDLGAITIGVEAVDAAAAKQQYEPFLDLLAGQMDAPVALQTYISSVELGQAAAAGKIGFAIISPTQYLELRESAALEAIATKRNKGGTAYCQGTLIAAKGSNIAKVSDLKGKRMRFGPEGCFNKYYAGLHAMAQDGLDVEDLSEVSYGTGCTGIAQAVLAEQADAGVICDYSWDGWAAEDSPLVEKLVIIGRGPKLMEKVIAAAAGTDAPTRERLVRALLAMKEADPVLMQPPLKACGFVSSEDKDYDSLRQVLKDLEQ